MLLITSLTPGKIHGVTTQMLAGCEWIIANQSNEQWWSSMLAASVRIEKCKIRAIWIKDLKGSLLSGPGHIPFGFRSGPPWCSSWFWNSNRRDPNTFPFQRNMTPTIVLQKCGQTQCEFMTAVPAIEAHPDRPCRAAHHLEQLVFREINGCHNLVSNTGWKINDVVRLLSDD